MELLELSLNFLLIPAIKATQINKIYGLPYTAFQNCNYEKLLWLFFCTALAKLNVPMVKTFV